ncbi:MAG: phosphotransferase [Planctomycetes bacterium]|nr:phosphotransferase [Planctomycetota bacterium]
MADLRAWVERCEAGEGELLAREGSAVWRLATGDGDVVVKRFPSPAGLGARVARRLGRRRAARADAAARDLAAAGIPVPEPLGWVEVGGVDYLVARFVDSIVPIVRLRARMAQAAGTFVGKLHAAGFLHGDLQLKNVLRTVDSWILIDHDRVRRSRRLASRAARAGELATLFRSANVHEPGALRHAVWGHFLRGYCRETQEWEPKQRKALTRAVLAQIG